MSERSHNRTVKLLASRKEKKPTTGQQKRIDREKTARVWYELKNTHKSSAGYFMRTAGLLLQYKNLHVLAKMNQLGTTAEFQEIVKRVGESATPFHDRLTDLWNSHKDKTHICRGYADMLLAFEIFEKYTQFKTDLFGAFKDDIDRLNTLYNDALTALRESAAASGIDVNQVPQAQAVEVPDSLQPPKPEGEEEDEPVQAEADAEEDARVVPTAPEQPQQGASA